MRIGDANMVLGFKTFDAPPKGGQGEMASFEASLLAEEGTSSKPLLFSTTGNDDVQAANEAVAREFLKWAQMSPEEKLRAQILKSKDLDEESLAALPPEERDAIEAEIREAVKQAFGVDDASLLRKPADGTDTPAAI